MATGKMSLATEFIDAARAQGYTDAIGVVMFARGLMEGDAEKHKAGYTADNAYLAALDAFEMDDRERKFLIESIGVSAATVARSEADNLAMTPEETGAYVEDAVGETAAEYDRLDEATGQGRR